MNIYFKESNKANFRVGRRESIKYIVVHFTAGNGDTACQNATFFANNVVGASAHYFVDEFDIYCSVHPDNTAWAVGANAPYAGTRPSHWELCNNDNSISVEICSEKDDDGNYYFSEESLEYAVEFVRYLMNLYNIDIHHVIRHYDVTGKPCPAPLLATPDWENFLSRIIDMPLDVLYDYEKIQHKCGLANSTMDYLMEYEYDNDLIRKLASAM